MKKLTIIRLEERIVLEAAGAAVVDQLADVPDAPADSPPPSTAPEASAGDIPGGDHGGDVQVVAMSRASAESSPQASGPDVLTVVFGDRTDTLDEIARDIEEALGGAHADSITLSAVDLAPFTPDSSLSLLDRPELSAFFASLDSLLDSDGEITIIGTPADADPVRVVVVDSQVGLREQLMESLPGDVEIITVEPDTNGFAFLADQLAGRNDIDVLHILSHGVEGELTLGASELDAGSMDGYAHDLAAIGAALSEHGDILLYGCDIGRGDAGQSLVDSLALLTGADVAASDDPTGPADLGGDWDLETRAGAVEGVSLSLASYEALLANPDLSGLAASRTYLESDLWRTLDADVDVAHPQWWRLRGGTLAIDWVTSPDSSGTATGGLAEDSIELPRWAILGLFERVYFDAHTGKLVHEVDIPFSPPMRTDVGTFSYTPGTDSNALTVSFAMSSAFTKAKTIEIVENTIEAIRYHNSSDDPTPERYARYTITDSSGGSNTEYMTIRVSGVNDAPVASNDTATTNEDTDIAIHVLANDTDVDNDPSDLSIHAVSLGIVHPEHGSVSIVGDTVVYTPDADYSGSDHFFYTVTDGNLGMDTARVDVSVTPVNDPPVLSIDGSRGVSFVEDSADPVLVFSDGSGGSDVDVFSDVDDTTLFGLAVAIRDQVAQDSLNATAAGWQIITDNGLSVSTATWTIGGTWPGYHISGEASLADYKALLESITYFTGSDDPTLGGSRTFRQIGAAIHDGEDWNSGLIQSRVVDITAVNDAPQLAVTYTIPVSYTENQAATPVFNGILSMSDADDSHLERAGVTIGDFTPGDELTYDTALAAAMGITVTQKTDWTDVNGDNWGTGFLFEGTATVAQYQALLESVAYASSSDDPTMHGANPDRIIYVAVHDGDTWNVSNPPQSRMVDITAVNDAPVNTVPPGQATDEDTPLVFSTANGNAISVSDPDGEAGPFTTTVQAPFGTLAVASGSGATITGDNTWQVTITGSAGQVNAALDGMAYHPPADTWGMDILTIRTSDYGYYGIGMIQTDTDTVNITIKPVNDAPVLSVTDAGHVAYTENQAAVPVFKGVLSVSDVDDTHLERAGVTIGDVTPGDELTYDTALAAAMGITVTQKTDWTDVNGDNWGSGFLFEGTATVAQYQALLESVAYASTSDDPTDGGANPDRIIYVAVHDGDTWNMSNPPRGRIVDITALNDAPVMNDIRPFVPILEDPLLGTGQFVHSLFGHGLLFGDDITDADIPMEDGGLSLLNTLSSLLNEGVAIVGADEINGHWEYRHLAPETFLALLFDPPDDLPGLVWQDVGDVAMDSALLLSGWDMLRFVPDGENGSPLPFDTDNASSITVLAWDLTSYQGGDILEPGDRIAIGDTGGIAPFSAYTPGLGEGYEPGDDPGDGTRTSSIYVQNLNDRPVLDDSLDGVPGDLFDLGAITEDSTDLDNATGDAISDPNLWLDWPADNPPITVGDILDNDIGDVDDPAYLSRVGMALTGVNDAEGVWWYSTDGATWTEVGAVGESSALLLAAGDMLLFVPNAENGTPLSAPDSAKASLTFRAWDRSFYNEAYRNGDLVDVSLESFAMNAMDHAFQAIGDALGSLPLDPDDPPWLNLVLAHEFLVNAMPDIFPEGFGISLAESVLADIVLYGAYNRDGGDGGGFEDLGEFLDFLLESAEGWFLSKFNEDSIVAWFTDMSPFSEAQATSILEVAPLNDMPWADNLDLDEGTHFFLLGRRETPYITDQTPEFTFDLFDVDKEDGDPDVNGGAGLGYIITIRNGDGDVVLRYRSGLGENNEVFDPAGGPTTYTVGQAGTYLVGSEGMELPVDARYRWNVRACDGTYRSGQGREPGDEPGVTRPPVRGGAFVLVQPYASVMVSDNFTDLTLADTRQGMENETPALTFTVNLDYASDEIVTIGFRITGDFELHDLAELPSYLAAINTTGSADLGNGVTITSLTSVLDNTVITGTMAFASGEASKDLVLTVVDDALDEPAVETVTMTLENPDNAFLPGDEARFDIAHRIGGGQDAQGSPEGDPGAEGERRIADSYVIHDDPEDTSSIFISDVTVDESEGKAAVTVTKTGRSEGTVAVSYLTGNGTALAGSDYMSKGGQVQWAQGETGARTIEVTVYNDDTVEPAETFSVVLTSVAVNAVIADNVGVVTIVDGDVAVLGPSAWGFGPSGNANQLSPAYGAEIGSGDGPGSPSAALAGALNALVNRNNPYGPAYGTDFAGPETYMGDADEVREAFDRAVDELPGDVSQRTREALKALNKEILDIAFADDLGVDDIQDLRTAVNELAELLDSMSPMEKAKFRPVLAIWIQTLRIACRSLETAGADVAGLLAELARIETVMAA